MLKCMKSRTGNECILRLGHSGPCELLDYNCVPTFVEDVFYIWSELTLNKLFVSFFTHIPNNEEDTCKI